MNLQGVLLKKTDWRVLIVLDACRADALAERQDDVETIRSMGHITWHWVAKFARLFGREPLLYVTANPVVNRELCKHDVSAWGMLNLWKTCWGRHGPERMPTVHPADVNRSVLALLAERGQPERMVVHYIQPHEPHIGETALPYASWGRSMSDPLSRAARRHVRIPEALAQGLTDFETVRRAYDANLDLVLPFALVLAGNLEGTVVITSDHGELLGEGGLYGHTAGPVPELLEVPWWTK